MWFSKIEIENIKSFTSANANFSKHINVLVGPNNSGKSTVLNLLLILQHQRLANLSSDTFPIKQGAATVHVKDKDRRLFGTIAPGLVQDFIRISLDSRGAASKYVLKADEMRSDVFVTINFGGFSEKEPQNLIIPFLSRRRSALYNEQYTSETTSGVSGNHENLYAKVQLLSTAGEFGHELYYSTCIDIFGHPISVLTVERGVKAGYRIGPDLIPLTSMGDGVPQLLGFIVELCRANNKVFIIEEPENDIHPRALKALLKLIDEKSSDNQFFISTHSNIVLKYLGANANTKIHEISMSLNEVTHEPESTIDSVGRDEESRRLILEELGYEFHDFGLWKAWLLLEESSAERIINQFLIPWFVPELKDKLKTVSANSISQIEAKFVDLHRLFTYLHLEPVYLNKAWVIIDGGQSEEKIIMELRSKFKTWKEEHFQQFEQHDFERYYPSLFADKINAVLAIENKTQKRIDKNSLLKEVISWAEANEDTARSEFEISAAEVIDKLKKIEEQLR